MTAGPRLAALACPNCAAPLTVPRAGGAPPRFLACDHCGATLRVRRGRGDRVTARVARRVAAIGRTADRVDAGLARLRVEERLGDLDDRRDRRLATLAVGWNADGSPILPTTGERLTTAACAAVAAAQVVAAVAAGGNPLGSLCSLTFVMPAAWTVVGGLRWVRARRLERAEAAFAAERAPLAAELNRLSARQRASRRPPR